MEKISKKRSSSKRFLPSVSSGGNAQVSGKLEVKSINFNKLRSHNFDEDYIMDRSIDLLSDTGKANSRNIKVKISKVTTKKRESYFVPYNNKPTIYNDASEEDLPRLSEGLDPFYDEFERKIRQENMLTQKQLMYSGEKEKKSKKLINSLYENKHSMNESSAEKKRKHLSTLNKSGKKYISNKLLSKIDTNSKRINTELNGIKRKKIKQSHVQVGNEEGYYVNIGLSADSSPISQKKKHFNRNNNDHDDNHNNHNDHNNYGKKRISIKDAKQDSENFIFEEAKNDFNNSKGALSLMNLRDMMSANDEYINTINNLEKTPKVPHSKSRTPKSPKSHKTAIPKSKPTLNDEIKFPNWKNNNNSNKDSFDNISPIKMNNQFIEECQVSKPVNIIENIKKGTLTKIKLSTIEKNNGFEILNKQTRIPSFGLEKAKSEMRLYMSNTPQGEYRRNILESGHKLKKSHTKNMSSHRKISKNTNDLSQNMPLNRKKTINKKDLNKSLGGEERRPFTSDLHILKEEKNINFQKELLRKKTASKTNNLPKVVVDKIELIQNNNLPPLPKKDHLTPSASNKKKGFLKMCFC
jgi:hypothetical protein